MKIFVALVLMTLISFLSHAELIGRLEGMNNPQMMQIVRDKIYISEKTTISIYYLKNLKLFKTFGKEGEGPNEFKLSHGETGIKIAVNMSHLLVNSEAKLTYYSLHGDFLRELRVPPMLHFIPVGNKFVSNGLHKSSGQFPHQAIYLWEKNLKTKQLLFNTKVAFGMGAKVVVPGDNFKYIVRGDLIFLACGGENINIKIFDQQGKQLNQIQNEGNVIPLTSRLKEQVKNFYRTDPGVKDFWEYYKKVLTFPKNLPGLKDFEVDGTYIYAQTYEERDNQYKWLVFDKEGKIIKTLYLPIGKTSPVAASPLAITNNTYYYLKENLDKESWELFAVSIK